MSLESEVTLSLSLASSSGPRDTPASRVDPLEPMLQGRLRNTSAPMPHQPLNATLSKRYCRAGRESTRKKGDVRDKAVLPEPAWRRSGSCFYLSGCCWWCQPWTDPQTMTSDLDSSSSQRLWKAQLAHANYATPIIEKASQWQACGFFPSF